MAMRRLIVLGALLAPLPASAAPPRPSLEQRVQRMEDESAIRRILIEYGAFLDAKDFGRYAALFAKDGEWVGGFGRFSGPAAIEKMLIDHLGAPEPGYINKTSYHLMSNPIITISGDSAHVTSKYLFVTRSADNKPVPALAGRYVDDLVREHGAWKVRRRVTHGVIPYRDGDDPVLPPPPPGIGQTKGP